VATAVATARSIRTAAFSQRTATAVDAFFLLFKQVFEE
tara:strand:- start:51 stop:164 length:114 start_codon:yes stop_codon:yes gene_type:complete